LRYEYRYYDRYCLQFARKHRLGDISRGKLSYLEPGITRVHKVAPHKDQNLVQVARAREKETQKPKDGSTKTEREWEGGRGGEGRGKQRNL
jgi:hypothetical protein